MWKITKTQEEKEHERLDKEMIAFYKILPLDQKKRANLALVHGRIEALEQTTIIPKQTTKIVESSDEVTEEITPTKKATKADWINVRQHLDNKIYFKGNRSGNINADKGNIDSVIELIESMPVLPKCVKISVAKTGNRKGLKTLFVNINSKYGGIPTNQKHAVDLLAKLKFEAVMP
tara:strand:- start:561 stop:1088 length:528 start_codon:yes stop_codon:yes gene_type:complete